MTEQEQAYDAYIKEHILNVEKVWKDIQPLLKKDFWLDNYTSSIIQDLINAHNASKNLKCEFYGYRQWFYPEPGAKKSKALFDVAWNHHQKNNPHHWEYWVMNNGVVLEMPFGYIFEMLCDWTAMSYKFKDIPGVFYSKNKVKMDLTLETRVVIERWLPLFNQIAEEYNKK